jgi:CDP-diacylglycerol---serine O-phosphatidyltransferase
MACKRSSVRPRYSPQNIKKAWCYYQAFYFFRTFTPSYRRLSPNFIFMKKHIPNTLTLLNLFCGCCTIVSILNGQYTEGAVFTGISLIADFLDGFAARQLGVSSPLGLQLDSLADMVSFGVVPGVIIFELLKWHDTAPVILGLKDVSNHTFALSTLMAFIVTLFSCLRLAKFNLDTRQTQSFIGLNTPSNTVFFVGLMLIAEYNSFGLAYLVSNPVFIYCLIPISSYLLVSEIPMFSMKGGLDRMKIAYLILSLFLIIIFKEVALSLVMILYVIINIFNNLYHKKMTPSVNH